MTSRIIATCPQCNAHLAVGNENAGKRIRCPKCQAIVQVPDVEAVAPEPSIEPDPQPESGSMADRITTTCPNCDAKLAVGVENAGRRLRCPKCHADVEVPNRSEDPGPPPLQNMTLWN